MVCYFCPTTSKSEYDCIQTSVENIIKHCSYLNQEHQKQCKEIHLLKERNKQLNDVVTMMQRQKTTQSYSQDFISAKRRRKPSINENSFAIDSSSSDTSFNDELPQTSKLNVALDSEELLECSELNATVDDENIAETENVIKRRDSLLTAIRSNISVNSLREANTNNSIKPVVNMNKNNNNINKADWLAKAASHQKITHFIAPLASENAQLMKKDNDKKINLSLNKKNVHKFKQTRLQLDGPHERSYDKVGNLVNNDVIINSPIANSSNSSLKQAKASRSWLLRVSNNSKENLKRSPEKILHVSDHMANNDTKRDNHVSQIEFDISNNDITKSDELLADILAEELNEEKTSEKSVLVLTPATQDIIFLDDTDIDSDIIVNHKERASLNNSREHERDNLIEKPTVSNFNIKKEMSSQDNTNILDETFVKELEEIENVKEENRNILSDKIKKKLPDTEDSEDFMVLPIMVKEEECSEELLHKKQSIKERFNIDCQDCLKYIAFLGDNLSDGEIMSHIRQCSRHKESELLRWNTPDGFWDPFIRSFNENDPRKEVLIDTRFASKRGGK